MKDFPVAVEVEPAVEEYCVKPVFDADGVQVSSGIGPDGKEWPDPVPMSPPVDYNAPPDLMELIRSMVRSEQMRSLAQQQGFETFEESDDFEVEDDPLDPLTPYEKVFEAPPPTVEKVAAPSPVQEPQKVAGPSEGAVASPPPGNVEAPPPDHAVIDAFNKGYKQAWENAKAQYST